MFFRADLDRAVEDGRFGDWHFVHGYPGLYFTVYPQLAFRVPDSEELIRVTRAAKEPGDSGVRFWIAAETSDPSQTVVEPWAERSRILASYAKEALARPLSEAEFNHLVESQCRELIAPLKLPLHPAGGFVGALAMLTMEVEFTVSLFAEYADEFIHFYWETTA